MHTSLSRAAQLMAQEAEREAANTSDPNGRTNANKRGDLYRQLIVILERDSTSVLGEARALLIALYPLDTRAEDLRLAVEAQAVADHQAILAEVMASRARNAMRDHYATRKGA